MAEITKEQLIAHIKKEIREWSSDLNEFDHEDEQATREIAVYEIALAALTAEPFMHGIVDPEGIAHMDENCVALKPWALGEEVDALNDECPEPPFKVVPLYRLPLLEGLK